MRNMNPIVFVMRRPIATFMLVVALGCGSVLGLSLTRVGLFAQLNTPKIYSYLEDIGARAKQVKEYVAGKYESYFHKHEAETHHETRKVVVTSPRVQDVTITQPYVCQIHSRRHIEIKALELGYLQEVLIREGQSVKQGAVLFKLLPVLYKARLDAKKAEALLAEREYNNTLALFKKGAIVSENEVLLFEAKKNFTNIIAPFDGIVDRQREQLGSLIKEGEVLTTLSDNGVMWVYFNVPESQYLSYKAMSEQERQEQKIELRLANQEIFPHPGKLDPDKGIGAIEGQFNNENGNIAFRADFDNPDRLLRHGQTGTILIHRPYKNALVIPQRATFELLDKRYVWVIDKDDKAKQTLITIKHELDDIFVVNSGIEVTDKIVLEGIREVEQDVKVEYEFREPEAALKNQKFHAE
jgi:membrane fusion protein (multidrug efflux system)